MPVPAAIATAAANYKFNSDFLKRTVEDFSPEEWIKSPAEGMNHAAWIVGHCLWARQRLLSRLGSEWKQDGMDVYARGVKLDAADAFPPKEELLNLWRESGSLLKSAMENVSEDLLAQPVTSGPPSPDGKISGVVSFLAIHETYHLGQASYLRSWLGHKGLMG